MSSLELRLRRMRRQQPGDAHRGADEPTRRVASCATTGSEKPRADHESRLSGSGERPGAAHRRSSPGGPDIGQPDWRTGGPKTASARRSPHRMWTTSWRILRACGIRRRPAAPQAQVTVSAEVATARKNKVRGRNPYGPASRRAAGRDPAIRFAPMDAADGGMRRSMGWSGWRSAVPVVRYLLAPGEERRCYKSWVSLGAADAFPVGETRLVV